MTTDRPTYFVTGGTGLVGKHLVSRLLHRRGADLTLLVRPSSLSRHADQIASWMSAAERLGASLRVVEGDVELPGLGLLDPSALDVAHVFHIAALYDLEADDSTLQRVNVEGTRHLLAQLEAAGFSGTLHHISSIAVAGDFAGQFREEMLDEGQKMPHPYHRSKHDSERLVRELENTRYRIYRPSAVVGDSKTGEMDRADGPYFAFGMLRKLSDTLPSWVPLPAPSGGGINIVPVDFVADAIDHLAHAPDLDGQTFHIVDPEPPDLGDTLNCFLAATRGPSIKIRLPMRRLKPISGLLGMFQQTESFKFILERRAAKYGVPSSALTAINTKVVLDSTQTLAGLDGSGISCPPLSTYARTLWRYWEDHLDPDRDIAQKRRDALVGKRVLVTGASMGVGEAFAKRCAGFGAEMILVARSADKLASVKEAIEAKGGTVHVIVADLSDMEACDRVVTEALNELGGIDVLVNNAARSIRRPLADSVDRFHDFERTMRLNYFGAVRLAMGFLPSWREKGSGCVVNVLTSGVFLGTPFFGAYLASKRALDAFSDCFAAEHLHEGIHSGSVYLPLVDTPMAAPTKGYKTAKKISAAEAADFIFDVIVERKRRTGPTWATAIGLSWVLDPEGQTRFLNLGYRFSRGAKVHPELDLDRSLLGMVGFKGIVF